jgi:integrase
MTGTVYKRNYKSGGVAWGYQLDAGLDENGKRIRISRGGFRRQADAGRELARLIQEKSDGLLVRPDPRTFGDFLEEWFREHAEPNCAPKTVERYRELAAYVLPRLGRLQLRDISPLVLDRLYNQLHASGGRRAAPLSAKTVRNIGGLVHVALNTAIRWKLLKINPADGAQLPKYSPPEARALDRDQMQWYFDAARASWLYPILVLGAATGARRGELLALTWPDLVLDITPAAVTISKSLEQTRAGLRVKLPKNGQPRVLTLPAIAVTALLDHRQQQQQWRQAFGPDYRTDLGLVFADPQGDYLKPHGVTVKAGSLARKIGFKGIGLHSLRHSHGSQLLSAGVSLPVVSKRLGHRDISTTARIYSHAFSRDEIAAAEAWDSTMRKASAIEQITQ